MVAAAVIMPEGALYPCVRDSKQIPPKEREEAFLLILENAVSIGIGVVSHKKVDEINILQASLLAMKEAVRCLSPAPDLCLVDGPFGAPIATPQKCIIRGDALVPVHLRRLHRGQGLQGPAHVRIPRAIPPLWVFRTQGLCHAGSPAGIEEVWTLPHTQGHVPGGVRLTRERLDLGKEGELLALRRLQGMGYKCIARNYRCALGEVDLIARDGDTLVFVEIKTRKGKSLGYAKQAVTERKKRQISKVALAYMKENDCCDTKSRFDVVAVRTGGAHEEIEVVKNAFELAY